MEAAGFDEEEEEVVRDLIGNNNFFGLESFLENRHLDNGLQQLFSLLGRLYQSAEEFQAAKAAAEGYPKIHAAMEHLERLQSLALLYGIDKYISFELGVISSYKYYSGIIFHGYTFGSGEPIVKGGRYDRLLKHFGKDAPAIGFVIVTDQMMAALSRQHIETPADQTVQLVVYDDAHREDAVVYARKQRAAGCRVELMFNATGRSGKAYEAYAKRMQMKRVQFLGGQTVTEDCCGTSDVPQSGTGK